MGCVKDIVVIVALTLSYPISPTVAMSSRISTPPSRHLLSSYGILFILLTMVSKVRHTFHMAQYHFASHSATSAAHFVWVFTPSLLGPFPSGSLSRQSGSICRHQVSIGSVQTVRPPLDHPGVVVPVKVLVSCYRERSTAQHVFIPMLCPVATAHGPAHQFFSGDWSRPLDRSLSLHSEVRVSASTVKCHV